MNNSTYKFYNRELIEQESDPIVGVIFAEQVQWFAEGNAGGRLSDAELNRVAEILMSWDDVMHLYYDLIGEAVEQAKSKKINWSEIDREFRKRDKT
jgi:hypothetical protein